MSPKNNNQSDLWGGTDAPKPLENHQRCNQTSGEVEWWTPEEILEAARRTLGTIDLDPASCAAANQRVQALRFFTQADDGLRQKWFGRVWMNHPFTREGNGLWVAKLVSEYRSGRVIEACAITYAATSEGWFQPLLEYPQCFLCPRTNYVAPDGTVVKGASKGSCVTYLGPDLDRFAGRFNHLGVIKVAYGSPVHDRTTEPALDFTSRPTKSTSAKAALDVSEALTIDCPCGKRTGVLLRHFEKAKCACGRCFWALRPEARGPLVIQPWPGEAEDDKLIQETLAELYPNDL
jgi:hypothetical protein